MPNNVVRIVFAAALGFAGCATASQQQLASQNVVGARCEALPNVDQRVAQLLAAGNIAHVAPAYHTTPHFEGQKPAYVAGAEIYIPAEAGMSAAYLERTLSCFAASHSSALANDPFHVEGVRSITASSVGSSFRVEVRGADRSTGEEILKHAQALRGSTRVEIRQLSSLPSQSGAM
jgi:hypothetical protein